MATSSTGVEDTFSQEVTRLRAEYQVKRQKSNAFPPAGRPILDMELVHGKEPAVGIWYDNGTELGQYVHLFDLPGTLSGNILRLERALPAVEGHFEIKGDVIRSLDECPNHPAPVEDDFEDVSDLVSKLPVVTVDSSKHFTKKGKYRSEIENLLKCQGGSCPGAIFSPHLIRLLGASPDGQLVFEKLATRGPTLTRLSSLETYTRWILHIIDAVSYLHSFDIVHRDLRIDNCLFTEDGSRLVVCDLESRWGQRAAPEVAVDGGLDSGWTTRSDIYDIGNCMKCMVYANAPITNQVEWPVPQPLQGIVDACMRMSPEGRPTLLELRNMAEAILGDDTAHSVDIGGNDGAGLRYVLRDNAFLPAHSCAVFDLPRAVAAAEANRAQVAAAEEGGERLASIQLVAGSVYEPLPAPMRGALVYQFRRILNDFADADVARAWRAVADAAAPDTRVYIIQKLLEAGKPSEYEAAQDLIMMMFGGKRRSAAMHAELAAAVGFRLHEKPENTFNDFGVLEFRKA